MGLLLHPTSLPGPEPIGTLGQGARDTLAWMVDAGMRAWQVLPLCEGGLGFSPYSSPTSALGSPWLIDLADLARDGLLQPGALPSVPTDEGSPVDYPAVARWKGPLLRQAAERLLSTPGHPLYVAFEAWRRARPWVTDAALFRVLRRALGEGDWWGWPIPMRDRHPGALADALARYASDVSHELVTAFFFDHQWAALRREADAVGVSFVGDVPIYVAPNSVEVWAHRRCFELAPEGRPLRVAGVPPDAFSETGQHWGNSRSGWNILVKMEVSP